MSHTYSKLLTHVIYSTKERAPLIEARHKPKLYPFLGGIVRDMGCHMIEVGGVADHVHMLVLTPPRLALSDLLREVKAGSSRWMNREFNLGGKFAWQTGFSAFSISQREAPDVRRYIGGQEEHHRVRTFKEEVLQFLHDYEIEYDERYLWD
jgi:REP element-mobilizing transposase RayT